jgi:lipoyl(octanoyl) transferase
MEKRWRLILDKKRSGFENMAVDEAILLDYSLNKIPTFRIYGWKEATVSLGYKQISNAVLRCPNSFPFVRRITGGAAILHDQELTYSIVCAPSDLDLPSSVKKSYYVLCSFLKHFYAKLGLESKFAYEISSSSISHYGSYCFSSWQDYDLIINGKKVGGNAQRRKEGIIFQHGSIPQKINFMQLTKIICDHKGIIEKTASLDTLLNKDTDFIELQNMLADSFSDVFEIEYQRSALRASEEEAYKYLLSNKYTQDSWNRGNEKTSMV